MTLDDCSRLVADPVNKSPSRSPQAVHTALLPRFVGKDLAEIGTHAGDGMACFAQRARSATAMEIESESCDLLHERARKLALASRSSFDVRCESYESALPDSDAITWWRESPLTNEGILEHLHDMQLQGKLRGSAMAYPLFDHKWPSDMASLARLWSLADWHANVTFDECDEVSLWESAWDRLGTGAKVARLVGGVLWPSLRTREYGGQYARCRGTFTVAEIPVSAWAGQAASLDSRAVARMVTRSRARESTAGGQAQHGCTVHRSAVLYQGKLWNVGLNGSLSLTSPFYGNAHIHATALPLPLRMPRCERVERGVIAAVAGGWGCKQVSHFLFNFLLPQWDAMEQLGWLPSVAGNAAGAGSVSAGQPGVHLFLDCGGNYKTGMSVASAPVFVREALPLISPIAAVHNLETHTAPPVCFGELLVGCPCAEVDEYSMKIETPELVTRIASWRRQLMALVLGKSEHALAWLAYPRRADAQLQGAAVVLTDRSTSRQWLNVQQSLLVVRGLPSVRSAALVHWEGMTLREQMRASMAADVMVGIDGSNLANALWMRNGSVVVDLMPYGARQMVPHLSDNFQRLWDVAGVQVLWSHSSRTETRVKDARCAEELRHNVTLTRERFLRCGLMDAAAWISPTRVQALVASAIEKSARFAPAFAGRDATSGVWATRAEPEDD